MHHIESGKLKYFTQVIAVRSYNGREIGGGEWDQVSKVTIAPLKKRTLNGDLYTRDPKIEALLVELSALLGDELIERAAISRRTDARYVPSECLVYFIRASRSNNRDEWFKRIYRILAERVLRCLPKPESPDGETASLTREVVRDKVFGHFAELLSADRGAYVDKLDYFEVRFEGAFANLRRDAQEKAWRDENRSKPLEYDDEYYQTEIFIDNMKSAKTICRYQKCAS
jgi:hypothetical protein